MGLILKYSDVLETYKTRGYRNNRLAEHKHLFPVLASPELAGIVADLIGDGSLQSGNIWKIDFVSKSKKELYRFNKEINNLFGVNGRIRNCSSNMFGKTYITSICNAPIARILYLCGVPSGAKVLQKFSVPAWIKEDKDCSRRFLQRIFSCEGTIMHERNRKTPQIRIDMWKSQNIIDKDLFMIGIASILKEHFKINSHISKINNFNKRKDGLTTQPTRLYLFGNSMLRFYKQIGFEGEKQRLLKKLLENV